MPRVNSLRTLANEANLARRIRFEREQKGWSYEGTASRMAQAGYPIQASGIYKIEKGDPPRRITVDEMVGFATVFGTDLDDLLIPVELVNERAIRDLIARMGGLEDELRQLVMALHDVEVEWVTLLRDVEPARRQLMKQVTEGLDRIRQTQQDMTFDDMEKAKESRIAELPYPPYVHAALEKLQRSRRRWADAEIKP